MAEKISRRDTLKLGAYGLGGLALNALFPHVNFLKPKEPTSKNGVVALNYDESNGDTNIPGQTEQVANYLRKVTDLGPTAKESDLIRAIQGIQKEAANAGATTIIDADSIDFESLPKDSTWLIWASNRGNITQSPSDIQLPFGMPGITFPHLQGQVAIVHAFDAKVPRREIHTFACNPKLPQGEKFWAVAVK